MSSNFRRRLYASKTSGISEVVGAMLLLIVVVVAVGTFAYYLNATQQQAQNRQNFINSVKNENLKLTNIQLASYSIQVMQTVYCPFTSQTSVTCAFPSRVPTTDDVVVGVVSTAHNVPVVSVSDNATISNNYHLIVSERVQPTVGDAEAWFAPITTAGALIVTVSWGTTTVSAGGIILYDVFGTSKAYPINFSTGTSGFSPSPLTVTAYTPDNNALIIGILDSNCSPTSTPSCAISAGTGYTLNQDHDLIAGSVRGSSEDNFSKGLADNTPFVVSQTSAYNEVSLALAPYSTSAGAPYFTNLARSLYNFSITVQNLNIAASQLAHIQVDNIWLTNFISSGINYLGGVPLTLPAKSSLVIQIYTNFTNTPIFRNQPLQIVLLTTAGNYFVSQYSPPTAIVSAQDTSEPLIVQTPSSSGTTTTTVTTSTTIITTTDTNPPPTTTITTTSSTTIFSTGYTTTTLIVPTLNDFPVFSGQQSQAQNSTFISQYFWKITFSDGSSLTYSSTPSLPYRASLVRSLLGTLPAGFQGPFTVVLMTEDANGFIWAQTSGFPLDPNISPLT